MTLLVHQKYRIQRFIPRGTEEICINVVKYIDYYPTIGIAMVLYNNFIQLKPCQSDNQKKERSSMAG